MPNEEKEAAEKALEDHGVVEDSDGSMGSEDEESLESAQVEDTDSASTDDSSEEDVEEGDKPSDSVQSLVDAAVKRSMSKFGRPSDSKPKRGEDGEASDETVKQLLSLIRGKSSKGKPTSLKDVDLNDPDAIESFFNERLNESISKAIGPIVQQSELREVDAELKELANAHPDYHKYGKPMAKLIEALPNLPLEYAYRIASSGDLKTKGRDEAYANMEKKKEQNLVTDTVTPPNQSPGSNRVKTSREAVLRAMDETGATFTGE